MSNRGGALPLDAITLTRDFNFYVITRLDMEPRDDLTKHYHYSAVDQETADCGLKMV
jgi:hypothetical protein